MASDLATYEQGINEWIASNMRGNDNPTARGQLFCQWCLENLFERSSEQALDDMEVSGGYDHSIDAFILYEERMIIIQTKYDTAHDWSEMTKFHYDMRRIRDGKVKEVEVSDRAQRIIVDIQDAYKMGWQVEYYYITNASFSSSERSKLMRLEGYEQDIYFYDLSSIATELEKKQQEIPESIKQRWFTLKLSTRQILNFADTTAVIAVSLSDMHDFVAQGENDLFASNVRQYLKGTKINTGIKHTIQTQPERFWIYNNGITIVCDDFIEENFSIKIQTPQIVNGCQTAKSIWDILSRKVEEERRQIHGNVLVRIIKGADEQEKQNITRYTNTQNAVRGKDFFSLEQFQKKLQSRFKSFGYHYEIQRGSFASLKPSEKAKFIGRSELAYLVDDRFKNLIPASEAIQAYAAGIKQIPAISYGQPHELSPNGSHYDKIFDDKIEPEVRLFLYPYLIREWARSNGYSRGGEGGWRAHSIYFFVYTYFLIVLEIVQRLGLVDSLETLPEKIPSEFWDRIFQSEAINTAILRIVDDILERYFTDSKVDEAVGLDIRAFLKTQDTLNRHKSILLRLIENVAFSARNKRIIEQIQSLL